MALVRSSSQLGSLVLSAVFRRSPTLSSDHASTIFTSSLSVLDVKVPPLAESIKDGAIAAVLKKAGESVKEDEVIMQIDTDKVTVDVKSPSAGVLEKVLVKQSDVVVVGQVVAVLGDGTGAASKPSKGKAAPEPKPEEKADAKPAPKPEASKPSAPSTSAAPPISSHAASSSGREPMIKFPPRRTTEGARISDLPADQADAYLAKAAPHHAAEARADQAPSQAAAASPPPASIVGESMKAPPAPKTKPFMGRPPVPKRAFSEKEMDLINLGGAP